MHNAPANCVDLWGLAPRNLTEEQREKYKKYVSSYEVSKSPAGVVCSTLGAYIASSAMEAATGEKEYYKNLQHDGEKLTSYFGIYAEDYSSEKDGSVNFTFYTDSEGNKDNVFNSPNVEVGTIGVFGTKKPLTVDEDGNRTGWTGHIITVTEVIRDTDGNELTIYGGLDGEEINFVLVGINGDSWSGKTLIIIFNDDYEILNYYKAKRTSSSLSLDITDKYMAFALSQTDTAKCIFVYDINRNIFTQYDTGYVWLWNIYIKDEELFFSSENAFPNLNVIDLKQKELYRFSDYQCNAVTFGQYNNSVYGGFPNQKILYKWNGNGFEKTSELTFKDLNSRALYIEDFPLSDDILLKLGFQQ